MHALEIVGLGLCTLDVLVRLEACPTWSKPVRFNQMCFDGGGQTGTALCAAAKLGARSGFIGTAGNDWFGEKKLQSLQESGVDIRHVIRQDEPDNHVVLVFVDNTCGERSFNLKHDFYQNTLKPQELDKAYLTQADFLITEGHHFEATLAAAGWMHAEGKKVMLDGAATTASTLSEEKIALTRITDFLFCGAGFAEALTGESNLQDAGRAALSYGPEIVVITQGEHGSTFFSNDESFHTPAFEVNAVDTTGAGDVFHGAFLVGLLKKWDMRRVCRFATAVAAIECTFLGGRSGIPTYSQVEAFLNQRGLTP